MNVEAIIEALREATYIDDEDCSFYADQLEAATRGQKDAVGILARLEAYAAGPWIPVGERLPEKEPPPDRSDTSRWCLVQLADPQPGYPAIGVAFVAYDSEGNGRWCGNEYGPVTHWAEIRGPK